MATGNTNPLGFKKPFRMLAVNPLDTKLQEKFTGWFSNNTLSEVYKDKSPIEKQKFLNGVLQNLEKIITNIGKVGVGAGVASNEETKDLYRDNIERLIKIVMQKNREISLQVSVLPHDLVSLPTQGETKESKTPVVTDAFPSHSSSKNPYPDYDYYVPDDIKFPKPGMRDKFGDKTDEYKALLHYHRELLRRHNGKFADEVRDVHNRARDIEQKFKVPGEKRQFRTTGTLLGEGTPKWRRLDTNSQTLDLRGKRTAEKLYPYSEGRCVPWDHSGQGCFSGGKRKTRKRKRKRRRKTRKRRKKKKTRKRKPKKRHRKTRKNKI